MNVTSPHVTAASSIAEHLANPSALTRISLLRQRIQKERTTLESSLSARAKEQVDSVREGLQGLKTAKNAIETIKENMKEVESNMGDPKARVEGFGKLAEVSLVHKRFVSALEMVTSLRGMYSRLSHISNLLATDRGEPMGPASNLLPIHYHLTELETFRNETLAQAQRAHSSAASKTTLEEYFDRLTETMESFEAHYFRLAQELLSLARVGNGSVAVKIAKIAQLEGLRDEKAIAIRLVKQTGHLDATARFKTLQAEARTLKFYKTRVLDSIRMACKTAIESSFSKHGDDGVAWLDDMEWLYDDLKVVEQELLPKFPDDWDIFNVYVVGYHKGLYDFLASYILSSPDAGSLLRLAQFTKEYKKRMMKEIGIEEDLISPALLDGKEQDLIENYLILIVKKMEEWTQNLIKTEISEFKTRLEPPEVDADGLYGMAGAVILFQMFNQQIDLALDSNQGAILVRVVEEAVKIMKSIQIDWIKLLELEFSAQVTKPDSVAGGLVEYTMALANDEIKCADFTESLNLRLEVLVSSKYKVMISDSLNLGMDGYLDVAKQCVAVLIDVVFNDLLPATKLLLSPSWYLSEDSSIMNQILETITDYLNDYQTHLNINLFDLLIEDIIDTFLINYLVAIRKTKVFKIPLAIQKMNLDIKLAYDYFLQFKSNQELKQYFNVIYTVINLISASKMMIFLDYWPFRKQYGINLQFIEGILKARDDLDKSAVTEVMDSIKRKVTEQVIESEIPSIFTRLPIK